MTEISEAAKAKARELLTGRSWVEDTDRIARYIQQVSGAAKKNRVARARWGFADADPDLDAFILPEPVDPLAEALSSFDATRKMSVERLAVEVREALAKRSLKIVEDK